MPTSVSYPGVYVDELPAGVRSIAGVSTSITAFVGVAATGPLNDPTRVFSLAEFESTFGEGPEQSDLWDSVRLFFENGGSAAFIVRIGTQADVATPSAIIGSQVEGTGLFALNKVDEFNLLVVPGQADPRVHAAMTRIAQDRRAFAILDLPASVETPVQAQDWLRNNEHLRHPNAAVYFPRVQVRSPLGDPYLAPNSGAIAGVYARTDAAQGVWNAAAGTGVELRGTIGLQYLLDKEESDELITLGANPLRVFDQIVAVWGARTLAGANGRASDWKYVPVRRLGLYLEQSLYRGTQWVVFEPNDEPLWAQVRLGIGAFLGHLFKQGAFEGTTPKEAYFVKCDGATNSQQDIDSGVINIVVGFAPLKPAEFVIITIRQIAGQTDP